MTTKTYGTVKTEIVITKEALPHGSVKTTITETDELEQLEPEKLGEDHSDYGICTSSVVTRTSDAYDKKVTTYVTMAIDDDDYNITSIATEEPIETHPAFKDNTNTDFPITLAGTGANAENNAIFEGSEEDSKFDYFPPNAEEDLAGVDSYLVPSVVLEHTKKFKKLTDVGWSQLYDVGKIKAPQFPTGVTFPTAKRNWLLIGSQYRYDDGLWVVTNQYQLSGRKGWNKNIYIEDNANV